MSKLNNDNYVCPVFAKSGKCGEQDALRVMEQFKDFYEEKLNEIDVQGGGDCLEVSCWGVHTLGRGLGWIVLWVWLMHLTFKQTSNGVARNLNC